MSSPFTQARPAARRSILAAYLVIATMPLACGSTAAAAADMPLKAPAPPAFQWSGCYAGLNAGGGGSGTNFTATVDPGSHLTGGDPALVGADGSGSANFTGFLGGGQAGCNWQSGLLVYGLEGDFDDFHSNPQFSNNTDTLSNAVTPLTVTQSLTTDFLATMRPRIGIAADRNFAYLTGGAAFTRASFAESYVDGATPAAGTGLATGARFLAGWTAGAGWEYAWSDHWTLRVEYLFASFSATNALGTITDSGGGANTFHGSADLVVQLARLGVNFKF